MGIPDNGLHGHIITIWLEQLYMEPGWGGGVQMGFASYCGRGGGAHSGHGLYIMNLDLPLAFLSPSVAFGLMMLAPWVSLLHFPTGLPIQPPIHVNLSGIHQAPLDNPQDCWQIEQYINMIYNWNENREAENKSFTAGTFSIWKSYADPSINVA